MPWNIICHLQNRKLFMDIIWNLSQYYKRKKDNFPNLYKYTARSSPIALKLYTFVGIYILPWPCRQLSGAVSTAPHKTWEVKCHPRRIQGPCPHSISHWSFAWANLHSVTALVLFCRYQKAQMCTKAYFKLWAFVFAFIYFSLQHVFLDQ